MEKKIMDCMERMKKIKKFYISMIVVVLYFSVCVTYFLLRSVGLYAPFNVTFFIYFFGFFGVFLFQIFSWLFNFLPSAYSNFFISSVIYSSYLFVMIVAQSFFHLR